MFREGVAVPLPNFAGKHALPEFVMPPDALRHLGWSGAATVPPAAVMVYSKRLVAEIVARYPDARRVGRAAGVPGHHVIPVPSGTVALVGGFGIGAPAAAVVLEEIVAAGARAVISIGGAGGLLGTQAIGDVVVCDRALRDEGVSYHYLAPDDPFVRTDPELTRALLGVLEERGVAGVALGGSWTTDAPYRETREEVLRYRAEGLLAVEMEAAALAAVSRCRGVPFATAFAVMDSLAEKTWRPEGLRHRTAFESLNLLFDAAAEALVGTR
jgi:uridine phosphorylase